MSQFKRITTALEATRDKWIAAAAPPMDPIELATMAAVLGFRGYGWQAALARRLGDLADKPVSRSTVCRWANGQRRIPGAVALLLRSAAAPYLRKLEDTRP